MKPFNEATRLNVASLHHKLVMADARLIAPGDPGRASGTESHCAFRGASQMQQVATTNVDEQAVEFLRKWISQLKWLRVLGGFIQT